MNAGTKRPGKSASQLRQAEPVSMLGGEPSDMELNERPSATTTFEDLYQSELGTDDY